MKEPARVPPKRTYGKKKTTATPAAAAIFGSSTEPSCISQSSASSPRDPLVDITSAISNLTLTISGELGPTIYKYLSEADNPEPATPEVKSVPQTPSSHISADLIHLNPLLQSYHADRGHTLEIRKWDQVFEGASSIVKIAEASYAEVYRITVKNVSSIIKVMPLRLPSDPPSMESAVAVSVEQVVSEIRIMNIMTEVPGFVLFKEAHLLKGKPSDAIISAWDEYNSQSTEGSFFPHPSSYSNRSVFLVVELGDAGEVLEHFEVNSIEKLWDIFLGVVMALSRAENFAEFEVSYNSIKCNLFVLIKPKHRDLHENNICISTRERSKGSHSLPEAIKFGRSDLEVTLIDYGLSRAKMPNGDVVFFDLETDLEVFRGEDGKAQFDTYRRYVCHLSYEAYSAY
jgi:serine/threonine-protein kinase haspin